MTRAVYEVVCLGVVLFKSDSFTVAHAWMGKAWGAENLRIRERRVRK